jgi:hypothetical protein
MKLIPITLLAVLCLVGCATNNVAPSPAGSAVDQNLTKQISEILIECQKIKPGMTRAELSKVFTTEGGLYTATWNHFVHRRCRYIKVDVEFTLSDPKQAGLEERPTNTISKISKPYLEFSVID